MEKESLKEAPTPLNPLRNQRGQSIVELGVTVGMLVLLCMGTLEIGRVWLVGNMVAPAAREGARVAALTSAFNRGAGTSLGLINSATENSIISLVKQEISQVLGSPVVNSTLAVNVTQTPSIGGVVANTVIPLVTVSVSGNLDYIFNVLAEQTSINRSVSFRNEGR